MFPSKVTPGQHFCPPFLMIWLNEQRVSLLLALIITFFHWKYKISVILAGFSAPSLTPLHGIFFNPQDWYQTQSTLCILETVIHVITITQVWADYSNSFWIKRQSGAEEKRFFCTCKSLSCRKVFKVYAGLELVWNDFLHIHFKSLPAIGFF